MDNTCRCRPTGNRDPKPDEVRACAQWTYAEIQECEPRLIVLVGGVAIRSLLGEGVDVSSVHGRALDWTSPWGKVYPVFCTYHPAAGMHNGKRLADIQNDFHNLDAFLSGTLYEKQDAYAGMEDYRALNEVGEVLDLATLIRDEGAVSADTEWTPDEKLWCASFSVTPGQAFVVWPSELPLLADVLNGPDVTTTLHQAQADLRPLRQAGISPLPTNLGDTMIMAYLLNASAQGLKFLAREYCGMQMVDYWELVGPYQRGLEEWYFNLALTVDIPPLPAGSRKRTVHQKIQRALNDMAKGEMSTKPQDRWDEWELWEKAPIVEALGAYPQASLADVPLTEAIWYSCRDADATERTRRELGRKLEEWSSFR